MKLDELSAQIRQQGEGITTLLQALDERDSEIAGALRALGEAQQAQALRELREEVRARPPERLSAWMVGAGAEACPGPPVAGQHLTALIQTD